MSNQDSESKIENDELRKNGHEKSRAALLIALGTRPWVLGLRHKESDADYQQRGLDPSTPLRVCDFFNVVQN